MQLWPTGRFGVLLNPCPQEPTSEEEGPMRTWTGMAALLALTFWLGSCATNPATGEKQISLVSQSQEIQMGAEADKDVQSSMGYYDDSALNAYIDQVGHKLAAVTERPDLDWHFHVVDSPEVNAFALPGGYIYVTRGILAVVNNEAQLAGVMGHEEGHVTARHSAQQMTNAQLANLGLGLGSILSSGVRQYAGLAGTGLQLLFLKFSRSNESQADQLGVRYTSRANWDPREIPATYQALGRLQAKSGSAVPSFLETHPDPGNREAATRQEAEQAIVGRDPKTLRVGTAEYKTKIAGMVYGDDPRQGYFEDGTFYHPGLRFQLTFPSGWKTLNSRSSVTGASSDQQRAIQLSVVPTQGTSSPSAYVQALEQKNVVQVTSGGNQRVSGWPAWVGTVNTQNSDGSTSSLALAIVQRESGSYYQFLGAPGGSIGGEFSSVLGSFRDLSDPSKLDRQPDRLELVTVSHSGQTLQSVASGVKGLAVSMDDVAFLNNMQVDTPVPQGYLLKVVQKGTAK
jgi:predicted Zn-dependent protease